MMIHIYIICSYMMYTTEVIQGKGAKINANTYVCCNNSMILLNT